MIHHLFPLQTILITGLSLLLISCTNESTPTQPVNNAPVVSIDAPTNINEGSNVQLRATVRDEDGDAVAILWSQTSGPTVILSSLNAMTTSFQAPTVNNRAMVQFQVSVTDSMNAVTRQTVSIAIINRGPSPQGISGNGQNQQSAQGIRGSGAVVDGVEVRNIDGSGNNVDNVAWGASFMNLQRIAPSDYSDGISEMAGRNRPSARVVSNSISAQEEDVSIVNNFNGSDFVWQWGQFIDHDIDLTDGAEEAANIEIPEGDIFFDPNSTGSKVMLFNRALFDEATGDDVSNPRQQINEITSWIDGSMVYGSDTERNDVLRETATPFLRTSSANLLPLNTNQLSNANGPASDPAALFLAGDVRANEQVGLTTMHTLFVREHNRIARNLMDNNPSLSSEAIYQRARRIVVGKIQQITFNEWLPVLVGQASIPIYRGYDDTINPTIFNEFSVAAFRLGHSMLNERLFRLDANGNEINAGHLSLSDAFFSAPSILQQETDLDPILRGLASQMHQTIDTKIIHDVRNLLFGQPGSGGLDLVSLNIQRGRDHGIASYNAIRTVLGLTPRTNFNEITDNLEVVGLLESLYSTIDNIDFWVGGLSEPAVSGSQLGETFHNLVVRQFLVLRDGDRFWYENYLTGGDLRQVQNSSLAQIIRDNTSIGSELQDNVFLVP